MDNEETLVLPVKTYDHLVELCEQPPELSPEVKDRWRRARERLEALSETADDAVIGLPSDTQ